MARVSGSPSIWPLALTLVVLALAHAGTTWAHRHLKPELTILDQPPSELLRTALAFGDGEFLYRAWFLDLQNAGDTGGRMTPMRDYNYDNVIAWLQSLQALDLHAQAHTYLAAHYFSLTPKLNDVRHIVEFINDDAQKLPQEKWAWFTQAAEIAEVRLHDLPYAIELSERAATTDVSEIPAWVRLFPAVLLAKAGRYTEARTWVADTVATYGASFSNEESNWVVDFLHGLPSP
jgi:hypothetical protein